MLLLIENDAQDHAVGCLAYKFTPIRVIPVILHLFSALFLDPYIFLFSYVSSFSRAGHSPLLSKTLYGVLREVSINKERGRYTAHCSLLTLS